MGFYDIAAAGKRQNATPPVDDRFIITVRVTAGYTFYYPSAGLNNTPISWGDGQSGVYSGGVQTHTYTNAGDYQITNSGKITDFNFQLINSTSKSTILSVDNGGLLLDNIIYGYMMFYGCSSLFSVNATFNSLTNGGYMFNSCTSLTSMPTATFNSLTSGDSMFSYTMVNSLPNATFNALTSGSNMFQGCSLLTAMPNATFNALTDGSYMFQSCSSLTTLPLSTFNNIAGNSISMFQGCSNLTSLPNATFNSLTYGYMMFYLCGKLTTINATFNLLTNGGYMFNSCSLLKNIPNATFASLTSGSAMFSYVTLNTVDYSNILIRTSAANPPNNVAFDGGYSKYNSVAVAARASLITNDLWSIADGGLE